MPLEKHRFTIHVIGTDKVDEVKMQKYAMEVLKKEGIPFIVGAEPNGGFAYTDDELVPFIKEMGVENPTINISMIRKELCIGHERVHRIMERLVEDGWFKRVKSKRGVQWRMCPKEGK